MIPGLRWDFLSITILRRFFLIDDEPAFPKMLQQPTLALVAFGLIVAGTMEVRGRLQQLAEDSDGRPADSAKPDL